MAEVRLNINMNSDTDWRDAIKKRRACIADNHPDRECSFFSGYRYDELVCIEGTEYWFEPDRTASSQALDLPRNQVGSFGAKNSVINFYDYHQSIGSPDAKQCFLDALTIASEETLFDGNRYIHWKNCCSASPSAVRTGLYDYLQTYVWPEKCSEIVNLIDAYTKDTSISEQEMFLRAIIIGEDYFNDLFYLTSLMVAEAVLTPKLINSMLTSVPRKVTLFSLHSTPYNVLITQLDEAQRHIFRTNMEDGEFARESYLRPIRQWRCSPRDLKTRILPLILFISNWSLVLGAYLTIRQFGALSFTVGE